MFRSLRVRIALGVVVAAGIALLVINPWGGSSEGGDYIVPPGPGQTQPPAPQAGWQTVKPVSVKLPTDDPVNDGTVPDDGIPTVVNMWASWCGPCKTELPILEKIAKSGKLHVIGFSRDINDSNAAEAMDRFGVTYPNWLDTDASLVVALDGKVPLGSVPSSVLIKDGKVVATHIGDFKSESEVLAALEIK